MTTFATDGDRTHVLHVDDDPDFAELTAEYLERENDRFSVEVASSVDEGLTRVAAGEFDCVVSDYEMPERDGIEFLKTVRDEHPDLPFILFTGRGSEEVAGSAISAGVTDYLQKQTGSDQYSILANRIQNAVDRTRAERERRRQIEAIETADEGISILGETGHYAYVNQAFADLHGYPPDEMIGEHWELVYPDDDVRRVREEILPDVERTGYWHGETKSLRADGTTVEVDHTLATTEADELVCTVRDISARKQRRRKLDRSLTRLQALFENSPDMINVHDADGNIIASNSRLCEKTGYAASELSGRKIWELNESIDPEETRELWHGVSVEDSRRIEATYRCRDGSTFPAEVHVQRLDFDDDDRFVAVARDISDHKQRERELERYERLIEHLPVGVFRTTVDGDILSLNDALVDIFAADSRDRLCEENARSLYVDEDDRQSLLERVRRDGIVEDEPLRMQTVTGEPFWAEVTLRLVRANGEQYLDGVLRDVTDRRRLAHRRERAETIFEHTQDALFLVDVDNGAFRVRRVNRAYERLTGLQTQEMRGKTPREILGEEQAAMVETHYQECLDRREPIEYDETLTINGETRYWHTRLTPVVEDGRVVQLVGATRDVTEHKRRIEEMTELKRQYQALCESIPNGAVFLFDDDLEYVRARGTELQAVGLSPEEIEGRTPHDVFSEELADELTRQCKRALNGETRTFTQTLGDRTYRNRVAPVESGDESIDYGIALTQNVTDQIERKRRLEAQNERLEKFASVVSHDLRNPLQVAEGRLRLAREECESDHIDHVERALNRMDGLIEDLLTLARQGEPVGETRKVDLVGIVKDCLQTVETGESTVVVDVDRAVEANRSRLAQLFENLIRNAVEHGDGAVTIAIDEIDDGFYVEDDGPGIPEGQRRDVFDAGYSTAEHGTGFGLSIVEEVANAHGWNIRATEATNGGARFEVTGVDFV